MAQCRRAQMSTFEEIGLNSEILQAVSQLGFETPTPIQIKTIPYLLSSAGDMLATAQTGTGKTAAFGLPAIQLTRRADKRTQTLVLCPTRELCLQITKDLDSYAQFSSGVGIVPVYGGANIETQIRALKKNAQIVVATPGRALDLVRRKKLLLGTVERVVLDEADEMLSMGFKEDLDAILSKTPLEKQTLLFSATMSREVNAIAKKFMPDAIKVAVAKQNIGAENVRHVYYVVAARDKYELLKRIADMNPEIYGIVFCRTRRDTREVAHKLIQDGYNAGSLHGELSQAQRDEVMNRFQMRQLQILVATDIAARGLDVDELTHILSMSLPDNADIYTHRSGRTGRAGRSGISIALIHSREVKKLKGIERNSGIRFTQEMAPTGREICTKQLYALIDKIEKVEVDEAQIGPFLPAIYKKLDWLSREDLIKHFVSAEFNRFLAYYKDARDINYHKGDRGIRRERSDIKFNNLFINLGSKNGLNPTRLIGLINDNFRSKSVEIGRIEILKKFSFVEIEETKSAALIKALKGRKFKGTPISIEESSEAQHTPYQKKKKFKRPGNPKFNPRNKFKKNKRNRKSRK